MRLTMMRLEAALAGLAIAGCATMDEQGPTGAEDEEGPIGTEQRAATISCSELATAKLRVRDLRIISAIAVAASDKLPAHCQITGALAERTGIDGKPYAIGFEVRAPDAWNGKFFFQGGGGTNGVIVPATGNLLNAPTGTALALGYAVASTDGGHATGQADATFGVDPQARSDYGYNAVGRVTTTAKRILATHYGRAPSRSYFVGCSNGGRDAMVAAARFADHYDDA